MFPPWIKPDQHRSRTASHSKRQTVRKTFKRSVHNKLSSLSAALISGQDGSILFSGASTNKSTDKT
jgi:hypothetical protein